MDIETVVSALIDEKIIGLEDRDDFIEICKDGTITDLLSNIILLRKLKEP